jgi:soluble lytic murein transglycosylase-like protein
VRTGTHLTIHDYFKQSNPKGFSATKIERFTAESGPASFAHTLAVAQATTNETPRGLSIGDYLKNPVRVQQSVRRLPAEVPPSDTVLPVPTPAEPPAEVISDTNKVSDALDNTARVAAPAQEREIIAASIQKAAARYDLPPALVHAVVKAESNFQVHAVSPAGAQGLMQLMPATARELGVDNPFDIDQNIHGGAQYLRTMLDRFDGNLKLALSAYNAGPGTVAKYNGHVPYAETRSYVSRVMNYARAYSTTS